MKVLHYSDTSAPNFMQLYQACDVLVTTGDLTLYEFGQLESVVEKKPAFGVYGNHDTEGYLEKLGIINLHHTVYDWNGLSWGGFQGCPRYKKAGGPQYLESEAEQWSAQFPRVDVLLLHAGPAGMLDDPSDQVHVGSPAVRQYVLEKKPRYVFVGHQYSDDQLEVGETQLFRTYGARIVELA